MLGWGAENDGRDEPFALPSQVEPPDGGSGDAVTEGPRSLGHLPESLEELLRAVDLLEDALYASGFPNLNGPPEEDEAVEEVVRAAAAWARAVQRAYGLAERQRRYKGAGVLPFFKAGSGFDPIDDPVALLGQLPDEYIVAELVGRDLTIFEYTFSRARELHIGQARSLTDPAERGLAFTVGNWGEIQRRLMTGYAVVVKRVLGLANWIRKRIQELDAALLPRVKKIGVGSHNRVRVEVSQAGSSRAVELTHMQGEFLRGLAQKGCVTASRRTKMDVLNSIPELRPWIENRPLEPVADIANEASYGVAPAVQQTIWREE